MEKNKIETLLRESVDQVAAALPPVESVTLDRARRIIGCYAGAISPNFVPWLAAAAVSARSLEARFACQENIRVEMMQDHAGMLERFAIAAGASPMGELEGAVAVMRREIEKMDGLYNVTIAAGLEHASNTFIPWLALLARRCGSNNLEYTNVHGAADQKHAEQFLWALEHELVLHENAVATIERAVRQVEEFLCQLLTPQQSKTTLAGRYTGVFLEK